MDIQFVPKIYLHAKGAKILKFCDLLSCTDKENMVHIIIDEKPDMVDVKNDDGLTPLLLALTYNFDGKFNKMPDNWDIRLNSVYSKCISICC